jgi:hypothetical protein
MLKLTYTDVGLSLEKLSGSMETLVAQRVVLAMRVGQSLHVQPSRASFLLPIDHPNFDQLVKAIQSESKQCLQFCMVDDDFAEVSMKGSWIANTVEAEEGMFITEFCDRTEFFLHKLWLSTQPEYSSLA